MQHENRYHQVIVNTIYWHFREPFQVNSQNRHKMARESKHARLSIQHRCLRYMNTVNFTLFWIPECSSYIYVLRQRTSWLKPVLLFYSLIYIYIYMAACNEFYWDIILPYKNFSYDSMSSLYAVCFPRFMPTAMVEKYTVRWFCLL